MTEIRKVNNYMIFVFGSNTAGRHGKGAAKVAWEKHQAVYGQGFGRQGYAFAIPTKNEILETLKLENIKHFVDVFIEYAKNNPGLTFQVTRIGCGLAGYRDDEIAPLFLGAPYNCLFDKEWRAIFVKLGKKANYWEY